MLDIFYIALTLALFALVSLIAKGVERRGRTPDSPPSAKRWVERRRG